MILPRFFFFSTLKIIFKSLGKKMKKLRHPFVAMNMKNKCTKFHVASPSDCRLNPARAIELSETASFVYNFVQKTYTSEELRLRTIWPTFPFDFFCGFRTRCLSTSIPLCKKSEMTKNSNRRGGGGGPALIDEHCCPQKTQTCEFKI